MKPYTNNRGDWEVEKLEPIELQKVMTEQLMRPYRDLGWSILIDAVMDLSSPVAPRYRCTTDDAAAELSVNNAKRWMLGESDPAMLTLACSLAGVSEKWIKEKVATITTYPTRSEMKKMLKQWRAKAYEDSQRQTVASRLQCYMDFGAGQNDLGEIAGSIPRTEPVKFSGFIDFKKNARQHNRQVATGP